MFFCMCQCDKCGRTRSTGVGGITYMTDRAREMGWSVSVKDGIHYTLCPGCRRKRATKTKTPKSGANC